MLSGLFDNKIKLVEKTVFGKGTLMIVINTIFKTKITKTSQKRKQYETPYFRPQHRLTSCWNGLSKNGVVPA